MSRARRLVTGRKALSQNPLFSENDFRRQFHWLPWGSSEGADEAFAGMVQKAYKKNGIVFALCMTRRFVLSEARFQYRRFTKGRPGALYGDPSLSILEHPWPNGTTGDLINRVFLDDTRTGNAFVVKRRHGLVLPRPEYMSILLGDEDKDPVEHPWDIDAQVIGYAYDPPGGELEILTPSEVAHFAPNPDPDFQFRGMSWVQPVMNELEADQAATTHKMKFFKVGGTPQTIVTVDKDMPKEKFEEFQFKMNKKYSGASNAYKTWYVGGGVDVKVVGKDLKQLDLRGTQGAGETRIAADAGVPPVIAGFSEGLQAATYSNYAQARRRFADGTLRPLWRQLAGSLASIVDIPKDGSELWYDDRDIAFLREDKKDSAEIFKVQMLSYESGIRAGGKPDSVKAAVAAEDINLVEHTGLYSVQLQPPGTTTTVSVDDPTKAAELITAGWKVHRPDPPKEG